MCGNGLSSHGYNAGVVKCVNGAGHSEAHFLDFTRRLLPSRGHMAWRMATAVLRETSSQTYDSSLSTRGFGSASMSHPTVALRSLGTSC